MASKNGKATQRPPPKIGVPPNPPRAMIDPGLAAPVLPNPSDPASQPVPSGRALLNLELGRTGLTQWYGRVFEEFLVELQQEKGRKIYREMADNDPTIGALRTAIKMLIRSAPWRVESKDPADPRSEFIDSCRNDMEHTWEEMVGEIGDNMIVFGWHYQETVYKQRSSDDSQFSDNKIGWKRFATRSPESLWRWNFDPKTQDLLGMYQRPPPDYQERYIPLEKALHFRMETIKNNPEGMSALRNCYRPWYFKKYLEQIEAIGAERTAAGYPVMWIPAEMILKNDPLVDQFTKMAVNIRTDELMGMVMPLAYDDQGNKLYDFEFKSPGGAKQYDLSQIITRYDTRILMAVLVDFVIQGHDQTGSFAMARTKIDFFNMALRGWLKAIAGPFNRHGIPRLLELNGMDTKDPPQVVPGDVQRRDLDQIGNYILKLSQAGMPIFPDPEVENVLRNFADLPTMSPEELAQRELDDTAEEKQAEQEAALRSDVNVSPGLPKPQEPGKPTDTPDEPATAPVPTKGGDVHIHLGKQGDVHVPITVEGSEPSTVTIQAPAPTVVPAPVVNIEGAQVTIEAPAPVVVPAPQVTVEGTEVTVQAPPAVIVPAPQVTVEGTQVTVEAASPLVVPAPNVTIEKTVVEAPVVNVAAPNVTVEAAQPVVVPAPQVTVEAPIAKETKTVTVERDAEGQITRLTQE